jgi:hypothetical protein
VLATGFPLLASAAVLLNPKAAIAHATIAPIVHDRRNMDVSLPVVLVLVDV